MAVFFPWISSFETGIALIDDQHKELVDLLNELFNVMTQAEDRIAERRIMGKILDYTVTHFDTEENLMLKYGYSDYESHKREHVRLKANVLRLQEDLLTGKKRITIETATFLKDWLKDHVLQTDKTMVQFLISKGVK
jgi:hemerythrin-like metal-binding protein